VELAPQPARARADHDPSPAEAVERRQLLGQVQRMAVGEDEHARAQPHARGRGRGPRQHDHGLVQEGGRVGLTGGHREVVTHPHVVEAEVLGLSCGACDRVGPRGPPVLGQMDTETHEAVACQPMTGIVSYGTYIPYWRLDRQAIAAALGTPAGRGTRAVASYDEDTTSMGVEAARACLAAAPPGVQPQSLLFATAEPAYLDKTNATAIHAALGLDASVSAYDMVGSVKSGIGATKA